MERRELCPSCGEYGMILDEVDGVMACDSCGRVGDLAETEFRGDWQLEVNAERGSVGTFVRNRDGGAAAAKRLMASRTSHAYFRDPSQQGKDHYRDETMKKVDSVVSLLRVPRDQVEQAKHVLERTVDGDWGTGRWVDILVAASVYVVIRQNQLPLSIPEVANVVNSDAFEVGRMYNRILRKLDINMPTVEAAVFLERAASNLPVLRKLGKDVTRKVIGQGTLLLHYMQESFIFTGRRPLPVVAAALFLALEANELVVEFAEVADALGVGLKTAQSRYRECRGALVGFGQILPWGKDITLKSVNRHMPELLKVMETKAKIEKKKRRREEMSGILTNGQQSAQSAVRAPTDHPSHDNPSTTAGLSSRPSQRAELDNASVTAAEKRPRRVLSDYETSEKNCGQTRDDAGQHLSAPSDSNNDHGQNPERLASNSPPSAERDSPHQTICLACAPKRVCSCRDGFAVMVDFSSPHEEVHVDEDAESAMPGEAKHDEIKSRATAQSESRHEQSRWDGLPAAFNASVAARTRRLDKINLAKQRILEARQVLGCTIQTKTPSDASGENSTLQLKIIPERSFNKRTSSLDWEDLTMEHLLLSGANEAEIETGYYTSLLAKYPAKADIGATDDDVSSYIRSGSEVELLLQLRGTAAACVDTSK